MQPSTNLLVDLFSRLAGAILSAALACIIWEIGTRTPAGTVVSIARGVATIRSALPAFARFCAGLLFAALSVALVFSATPASEAQHVRLFAIIVFLAGLGIEVLIGADVRPLIGIGKTSGGHQ